jgi:hypothetical protein
VNGRDDNGSEAGTERVGKQEPRQDDPDLDPYEIEFLPEFQRGRGPSEPFVNKYGIVIGDHFYESPDSPLSNWSAGTDPAVMSGEEWVHPYKDIGFRTEENRDYFERGIVPRSGILMHPDKDAAYEFRRGVDHEPEHNAKQPDK